MQKPFKQVTEKEKNSIIRWLGVYSYTVQQVYIINLLFRATRLILSGYIEPQKSRCIPHIACCLPSGKTSQNILAILHLDIICMWFSFFHILDLAAKLYVENMKH